MPPPRSQHAPQGAPAWFGELDHTADVGIAVSAPGVKTLFERAAWGTFYVLTEMQAVEPRVEERVVVEASDLEDLLVRWLSELNFLHVTQGRLFCSFEVRDLSETRLVARVRGEKLDRARHTVHTEIKAVTYHGLEIRQDRAGWHAQIIFDM